MNHSILSADRSTHLKIVAIALIAAIATIGLAIGSRVEPAAMTAGIIKAGKPVAVTSLTLAATR